MAVLGGGLGAIAAAFYLTDTPDKRARFRVTVFTDEHRLGGKAGSGRNLAHGGRIEEHGLHILLGFYDELFSLLRATWDAWTPPPDGPFHSLDDALEPQRRITFPERVPRRPGWDLWHVDFPRVPGRPGDPRTPRVWLDRLLEWLDEVLAPLPLETPRLQGAERVLERLDDLLTRLSARGERADDARRAVRLARLGLVVARGYVADVLPHGPEAFDRIDHLEFRTWLRRHGADEELTWWAPVRAFYTLGFAFEGGRNDDEAAASIAAGVALRVLLEFGLGYRDAPAYRMLAGMGDVVFAPLYDVLRDRGVRFRFGRRVTGFSRDGEGISRVHLEVAQVGRIRPLVQVDGVRSWPSEPVGRLRPARRPRRVLRRGHEFDVVLSGIPAPCVPEVYASLADLPGWAEVLAMPTVATRAAQLWLRPPLDQLGFDGGSSILTGYEAPLDSWADMSSLLAREDVPAGSLHYLVACLPEGTTDVGTSRWLAESGHLLLPNYEPSDEIMRYERLNDVGSERYVQSPPGTSRVRLGQGESGVPNLFLAGDWTRTTLSAGSAEAAVESGRLAAVALMDGTAR